MGIESGPLGNKEQEKQINETGIKEELETGIEEKGMYTTFIDIQVQRGLITRESAETIKTDHQKIMQEFTSFLNKDSSRITGKSTIPISLLELTNTISPEDLPGRTKNLIIGFFIFLQEENAELYQKIPTDPFAMNMLFFDIAKILGVETHFRTYLIQQDDNIMSHANSYFSKNGQDSETLDRKEIVLDKKIPFPASTEIHEEQNPTKFLAEQLLFTLRRSESKKLSSYSEPPIQVFTRCVELQQIVGKDTNSETGKIFQEFVEQVLITCMKIGNNKFKQEVVDNKVYQNFLKEYKVIFATLGSTKDSKLYEIWYDYISNSLLSRQSSINEKIKKVDQKLPQSSSNDPMQLLEDAKKYFQETSPEDFEKIGNDILDIQQEHQKIEAIIRQFTTTESIANHTNMKGCVGNTQLLSSNLNNISSRYEAAKRLKKVLE